MISIGSITLPLVFDIFSRFASRTSPWMYTSRNGTASASERGDPSGIGTSSMKWQPSMIMRATQKNRMSKPVTSRSVG